MLMAAIPKAELHLHLEGSITPPTAVRLAARHAIVIAEEDVRERYSPGDLQQISRRLQVGHIFSANSCGLRALITERLADHLLAQKYCVRRGDALYRL